MRVSTSLLLIPCLVAKSYLTLGDTMDYSLPGSSVHGISQARILEWVADYSSRGPPMVPMPFQIREPLSSSALHGPGTPSSPFILPLMLVTLHWASHLPVCLSSGHMEVGRDSGPPRAAVGPAIILSFHRRQDGGLWSVCFRGDQVCILGLDSEDCFYL